MTINKKYKNDMAILKDLFDNLFSSEIDCLSVILYKLNESDKKNIILSFKELRKLSNYNNFSGSLDFANKLDVIRKKLIDDKVYRLFDEFSINRDDKTIKIILSNEYYLFVKNIFDNFNDSDIEFLTKMDSRYAKKTFVLLKRFCKEEEIIFSIEGLRDLLGVPEKYRMGNFTQKAIYPIERNLKNYFEGFRIRRIRVDDLNDTSKIVELEFVFNRKNKEDDLVNKIIDKNREYSKYELVNLGIDIINEAEPVVGIYKAEINLVGFYDKDGSFNVIEDQDKIMWRLI